MAAMPVLIGLVAASTAISAVGAISQGNAASRANQYNAQVANQNAAAATEQANAAAQIQQEQTRRALGASTAAYGASGISMEGTPLDVLANSAASAERDRQNILYKGKLQAAGYTDQSQLDSAAASSARSNAYMSATGILVGGAAKAYGMGAGGASSSAGGWDSYGGDFSEFGMG